MSASPPPSDPPSTATSPPPPEDPALVQTLRQRGAGHLVFGRFRLVRELGAGGMAVVWLANDERLGLEVALKFLPGMMASDREALHDLRREITRGLRLTHPGIVRLYDLEEDPSDGLAAITMEYVAGPTLADEKARQPGRCFDVAEPLLSWTRELCDVLSYLHERAKVVHRDVKPRNIMLTPAGELKLADFGIAATLCDSHSRLTQHPGSSGTPVYMSPQQALGNSPRAADDVYALGATLYELLTSKPPFFRGNMAVILNQVASKVPPSIAERRAELGFEGRGPIPREWEETIAACLAKEPEARPDSVCEVAERLGVAAPGGPPRPRAQNGAVAVLKAPPASPPRAMPAQLSSQPESAESISLPTVKAAPVLGTAPYPPVTQLRKAKSPAADWRPGQLAPRWARRGWLAASVGLALVLVAAFAVWRGANSPPARVLQVNFPADVTLVPQGTAFTSDDGGSYQVQRGGTLLVRGRKTHVFIEEGGSASVVGTENVIYAAWGAAVVVQSPGNKVYVAIGAEMQKLAPGNDRIDVDAIKIQLAPSPASPYPAAAARAN